MEGSYDACRAQKYKNDCEMTFRWVLQATDGYSMQTVESSFPMCEEIYVLVIKHQEWAPVKGQARLNPNFEENFLWYTCNFGVVLLQRNSNTTNKVWLLFWPLHNRFSIFLTFASTVRLLIEVFFWQPFWIVSTVTRYTEQCCVDFYIGSPVFCTL